VTLHEIDLPQIAQFRADKVTLEANFSIGLMMGGAMTQTPITIQRGKGALGSSVGSFTRQV